MKTKDGLSLIVLTITIIVMIILAGATIFMVDDASIIENSKDAVSKTNIKQVQEIAALGWTKAYTLGAREITELTEGVEAELEKNGITVTDYSIVVTKSGVTVSAKNN